MARITNKDLQNALDSLNDVMGYKGYKYNSRMKKFTGKGFVIEGAYGGNKLVFYGSQGYREVTSGFVSKSVLYDTMRNMIKGVYWYKNRNKK